MTSSCETGEHIDGPVVSVDGNATVNGTSNDGVLVISGEARIGSNALIKGDVLVIDGTARISGHVTDDVIVLHGRAIVLDGATVGGDVKSTKQPRVERGARVRGSVEKVDTTGTFTAFGIRILGLFWLAVTVSTAVLGLLFVALLPRAAQTTSRIGRGSVTKSVGVGLLVAIGVPVVALVAAITVVGLPFSLGTFGALGILHALGYVAGAYCFGRILVKEPKSRIGAFFAGWGILRAVALIPGIGVLVWIAASVWGIGALTIAAWRAGRGALEPPPEPKTPAVPPPAAAPASDAPGTDTATDDVRGRTSGYGNCVAGAGRRRGGRTCSGRAREVGDEVHQDGFQACEGDFEDDEGVVRGSADLDEAPQPERVHRVRQSRGDRRQRVGQQDHAEHREHRGGDQGERAGVPLDPRQGCGETAEREADREERHAETE